MYEPTMNTSASGQSCLILAGSTPLPTATGRRVAWRAARTSSRSVGLPVEVPVREM